MATSTVRLYNLTKVNALDNVLIDNIQWYLGHNTYSPLIALYTDFQYIKQGLDVTIKLPLGQALSNKPTFNFVSITNSDNSRVHYYWVVEVNWKGISTVQVQLALDTINTFQDLIKNHFTDRTKIVRQHKDRFLGTENNNTRTRYNRVIDKISELQGLNKYNTSNEKMDVDDDNNQLWYLIYTTTQGTNVADYNTNEAVNCYLMPTTSIDIYKGNTTYTMKDLASSVDYYGSFLMSDCSFTINGNTFICDSNNRYFFQYYRTSSSADPYYRIVLLDNANETYSPVLSPLTASDEVSFSTSADMSKKINGKHFFVSGYSGLKDIYDSVSPERTVSSNGIHSIANISKLNRTLSYLIKIIECPYCPVVLADRGDNTYTITGDLVLTDELTGELDYVIKLKPNTNLINVLTNNFYINECICTLPAKADRVGTTKNIDYESKMYHSDFYNYIINYDSFNKQLYLENISGPYDYTYTKPYLEIDYKQSNAVSSALGFRINIENANVVYNDDAYEPYLICNRNNESVILNSSYLNYLRNGYNYDVKTKNKQREQQVISTALQVGGGIASIVAGGLTSATGFGAIGIGTGISLITSAFASGTNIYYNNIQAEQNIQQKLEEAKASSNSVNASDDLSLLDWYNGNHLRLIKSELSDIQKNNVFDLFYNTGYLVNTSGIPDLTSRYMFNYIQCTPDLDTKTNPELVEYLGDIIARFEKGITDIHQYFNYDKSLENWEEWLVS